MYVPSLISNMITTFFQESVNNSYKVGVILKQPDFRVGNTSPKLSRLSWGYWYFNSKSLLRGQSQAICSCKPVKQKLVFRFILNMENPRDPSRSQRLNTSNIFNLFAEICPFSVSICSICCPFEALLKRESGSTEVNSPTTPAVTPWRQPAVRTGWHPWLLRRLRAPVIVHQAIINPPVNQSIPAKVSWRTFHIRQNKARVGIDPLHELAYILLSCSLPCPSTIDDS